MEVCSTYEMYSNSLVEIIDQLRHEALSQDQIAQSERNAVSTMERQYMSDSQELQQALQTIQEQYRSVWKSCTRNTGLKRPREQRPTPTNLSWKEAIRIQEQAACKIRNWFTWQTQQAFIERQKRIHEEAAQQAAIAAAQAEAEKKKAEEAARLEAQRAEALIEALKQKHRGY